jgi:hypothetical protein
MTSARTCLAVAVLPKACGGISPMAGQRRGDADAPNIRSRPESTVAFDVFPLMCGAVWRQNRAADNGISGAVIRRKPECGRERLSCDWITAFAG